MKKLITIISIGLLMSLQLVGQGGFQSDEDSLASARVPGMPLPKGIEINYNRLSGANIRSIPQTDQFRAAEAFIDGLSFLQFQLKVPLVLKPGTSLLMGFDYNERSYHFRSPENLESSVFREIETETLKSRELTMYYNKSLDRKRFISARMDLALNGDLTNINEERFTSFIRYSAAAIYGWKPHKNLAHGVGLYLNYTLGRPSVYPVFIWNKALNDRWGIEAKVPANFKLRHDLSANNRFYVGYALDGASYVINGRFAPLSEFESAELRRSDIAFEFNFEQRLYDFIWMQVGMGYSYNINFRVSEENNFRRESLIQNEVDPSWLFNFSVFVVPTDGLKSLFGF